MIRCILGFFGYVKVPHAAISLSEKVERFLLQIETVYKKRKIDLGMISKLVEAQTTLTEFLKTGRGI